MALTLLQMTQQGLITELARAFGMDGNAELVLFRAGFPSVFLPGKALNALDFWQKTCQMIENGASSETTLEGLLASAAEMLPGNRVFKGFSAAPLPTPINQAAGPATAAAHPEVFLAYSTKDRAEVEQIAVALRNKGVGVWFDCWNMPGGTPLTRVIDQAIRDIRSMSICIGGGNLGPWQILEVEGAITLFAQQSPKKRLIPTLLKSAPPKPYMPLTLQTVAWVCFNDGRPFDDVIDDLIKAIRATN